MVQYVSRINGSTAKVFAHISMSFESRHPDLFSFSTRCCGLNNLLHFLEQTLAKSYDKKLLIMPIFLFRACS